MSGEIRVPVKATKQERYVMEAFFSDIMHAHWAQLFNNMSTENTSKSLAG